MQANRDNKTKTLPFTPRSEENDARAPMPLASAYAEEMRAIHASEELMQETMRQMHAKRRALSEENKRDASIDAASAPNAAPHRAVQSFARRAPRLVRILAAAACVCLLLTGVYAWYRPALVPMTTLSARAIALQSPAALLSANVEMVSMTPDEYSALTGVDLSRLFEGYRITDTDCGALYGEGGDVLSDYASVWYTDEAKKIHFTSSTESTYEADMLLNGEGVLSGSVSVHFGRISEDGRLVAAWESSGHIFCMQSDSLARRTFVIAAKNAASLCQ